MTIFSATYGKGETRSTWGKENNTNFSEDNSNGSRNTEEDQGNNERSQRLGGIGADIKRTSTSPITKSLNGKLARQLRKWLQSQLAEALTKKQEMLNSIDRCDRVIVDLQQDLEDIDGIIQELEEVETGTET